MRYDTKMRRAKKLRKSFARPVTIRDGLAFLCGAAVIALGVFAMQTFSPSHTPLAPQSTAITIPWIPDTVKQWATPIQTMAQKYAIDPNLLAIIMTLESGGNPKAESNVGAQGLMQIMPLTAKDIAAKFLTEPVSSYDIFDPHTNIEFGAAYLAYLRDEFGAPSQAPSWNTTVELVAAGYNGGPGAANSLERGEGLASAETAAYSRDALAMWRERHVQTSPTYSRWLARGGDALVAHP